MRLDSGNCRLPSLKQAVSLYPAFLNGIALYIKPCSIHVHVMQLLVVCWGGGGIGTGREFNYLFLPWEMDFTHSILLWGGEDFEMDGHFQWDVNFEQGTLLVSMRHLWFRNIAQGGDFDQILLPWARILTIEQSES